GAPRGPGRGGRPRAVGGPHPLPLRGGPARGAGPGEPRPSVRTVVRSRGGGRSAPPPAPRARACVGGALATDAPRPVRPPHLRRPTQPTPDFVLAGGCVAGAASILEATLYRGGERCLVQPPDIRRWPPPPHRGPGRNSTQPHTFHATGASTSIDLACDGCGRSARAVWPARSSRHGGRTDPSQMGLQTQLV